MSSKQEPTYVKLSLSPSEIEELDRNVNAGLGTSRADLCRKALIVYLHDTKKATA